MKEEHLRGADFIVGGGEMADLIRRKDWANTPLGPIDGWPQSLRTTVSLCLASNFPINIIWGPEHTQIYNDGYRVVCGEVHPRALGEGYHVTWASAWPAIGKPFERALAGETSFLENQRMFLTRNGYLEETFFTFSTSPIRAEDGSIGGLFHPVTETTATMLAERRTRALRDLSGATEGVTQSRDLGAAVVRALQPFAFDLPVLMFYELDEQASCYRLGASHGLSTAGQQELATLAFNADGPFPMREAIATQAMTEVHALPASLATQPCGEYPEPPACAVMLPVVAPDSVHPPVLLVVGASPRLPFDEAYRNFLQLLASSVGGLLGSVRALEHERRRAAALAQIDRAKTAFFSNVSHEFRTPLTLLLGPLEDALHQSTTLEPALREQLELAHRNGQRLLRLVNSLLDFSRTEAGRSQAAFEPVDLAALTTDIASTFRSATDRAGLALQVQAPALQQAVYVDRGMWETIVLNLLSNAFKFTFDGSIRVAVNAAADGTHAQVIVADTGTGIPQQELPRLFDRFHRVEGAHGRSFEGSGIGLALVQELVRLHGGAIEVSSIEGRGTTFTITLPYGCGHLPPEQVGAPAIESSTRAGVFVEEALRWLPGEPEAAASPVSKGAGDAAAEPGVRGGRVLLADDNADMRGYVARMLASQGIEVTTACDGEEALAKARAQLPDLVLTDVMMPRLDGFGLLAAIRADANLRTVPVMLLSARAGEEARVEGLAAGADDYLTKPFSAKELVARVSANLRLNRERRQAAASLREAQKLEALGRLTGGVAHDFNNLMMVVSGGISVLERQPDAARQRQTLEGMRRAVTRGSELTRQLLTFGGGQTLTPKPVDLPACIGGMESLLNRTLGGNVRVISQFPPDLWPVLADPGELEMMLLNLAINARDAMPGGGTVSITTENIGHPQGLPAGDYVRISVGDTGVGMAPEVRERAFDPFFTTKAVGKGSGVGLAQVYGFAKDSGGTAEIESSPGRGTTVTLLLPRSHDAVPVARVATKEPALSVQRQHRVLVVEDDNEVAELVAEMLEHLGYQLVRAGTAAEALFTLEHDNRIDLVFSDVMMPGKLTGIDLARRVRLQHPQVRVVLTSGYAESFAQQARSEGLLLLPKPYAIDELSALMERALQARVH